MRCAGIDLGTNTLLMVVGEKDEKGNLNILGDFHNIVRLGEKVEKSGIIIPEAIDRAERVLKSYKDKCDELHVEHILAVTTNAMRNAANKEEVKHKLEKALGTHLNIISGDDEAKYTFMGSIESDEERVLIDIGGGSTEFAFGRNRIPERKVSIEIGSVKLTEEFIKNQPPTEKELFNLKEKIDYSVKQINKKDYDAPLVAVAGTATTLAAISQKLLKFEYDKIHNYVLDIKEVERIFNKLKSSTLNEIINDLHVDPKRADLITTGSLILLESMKYLKKEKCLVSAKGLRYGLLNQTFKSYKQ